MCASREKKYLHATPLKPLVSKKMFRNVDKWTNVPTDT